MLLKALFAILSSIIWNLRNSVVHGGIALEDQKLLYGVLSLHVEFKEANQLVHKVRNYTQQLVSWKPSSEDKVKINVDGAFWVEVSGCCDS